MRLPTSTSPYLSNTSESCSMDPMERRRLGRARAEQVGRRQHRIQRLSLWCHVMEKETFEDEEAAAFMNAHFLSVKVDREERPMWTRCTWMPSNSMTRRGGWPLNCVALPDGRPIWGGTYFRREQWIAGLNAVLEVWQDDPDKVEPTRNNWRRPWAKWIRGWCKKRRKQGL